uniref:Uncharacterized protein n=1 Tax=Callorhinchus milii TaxID=7868 RepID=A0A4W3I9V2_CALMI
VSDARKATEEVKNLVTILTDSKILQQEILGDINTEHPTMLDFKGNADFIRNLESARKQHIFVNLLGTVSLPQ